MMRVCYFGTYRASYSRNVIMIEGLRRAGVEVVECHVPLWQGIEDRVATTKGGWKHPGFWWRVVKAYIKLLGQFWQVKDFDVLVVGYPGQFDVFLARVLTWLRRKPLVWDVFMSVYLIALERGLDEGNKFTMNALRRLERVALQLPDKLVQDTEEYVAWLAETHGIATERFGLVPTGADDRVFRPQLEKEDDEATRAFRLRKFSEERATTSTQGATQELAENKVFRVIYYGTYIPNHGVEKIIEAARLLADLPKIQFELIGDGPARIEAETEARALFLQNVKFLDWMEKEALVAYVQRGAVCLGAFGETPQSLMTVQNKIFEGLAMGKPVLTGDSPAVRRVFTHKEHIYLCARTGQGIAEGVRDLYGDATLRARLARQGRCIFEGQYDLEDIGQTFRWILEGVVGERPVINHRAS